MDYAALYELLRKEKYSETLQTLSSAFLEEVADFFKEQRAQVGGSYDAFSEESLKAKKQFENSISIFRELMRMRKRKLLNLVFLASETGIMKRDFGNLLSFEKRLFELLVERVGEAEKELNRSLNGAPSQNANHKMIIITTPIEPFVDLSGAQVGPFNKGMLINMETPVADILISEGKATLVDAH